MCFIPVQTVFLNAAHWTFGDGVRGRFVVSGESFTLKSQFFTRGETLHLLSWGGCGELFGMVMFFLDVGSLVGSFGLKKE